MTSPDVTLGKFSPNITLGTASTTTSINVNSPLTPGYSYPVTGNKIGTIKKGTCSLANGTLIPQGIQNNTYGTITADYTGVYMITAQIEYETSLYNFFYSKLEIRKSGIIIAQTSYSNNGSPWGTYQLNANVAETLNANDVVSINLITYYNTGQANTTNAGYILNLVRIA